jgi:head-tail adaptor
MLNNVCRRALVPKISRALSRRTLSAATASEDFRDAEEPAATETLLNYRPSHEFARKSHRVRVRSDQCIRAATRFRYLNKLSSFHYHMADQLDNIPSRELY